MSAHLKQKHNASKTKFLVRSPSKQVFRPTLPLTNLPGSLITAQTLCSWNVAASYINVAEIFHVDFFETETSNTKLDRPTSPEKLRSKQHGRLETRNTTQQRQRLPERFFLDQKSIKFEIHRR